MADNFNNGDNKPKNLVHFLGLISGAVGAIVFGIAIRMVVDRTQMGYTLADFGDVFVVPSVLLVAGLLGLLGCVVWIYFITRKKQ